MAPLWLPRTERLMFSQVSPPSRLRYTALTRSGVEPGGLESIEPDIAAADQVERARIGRIADDGAEPESGSPLPAPTVPSSPTPFVDLYTPLSCRTA